MKCVEARRQQIWSRSSRSSRFGRSPCGATDRLAVGVGGDCGKRVLAAAVCVCVFLLGVGGVEC